MQRTVVTVGPLTASSANAIALSQTPNAGPLTLNGALASGGVATLPQPRRVLITTTGNESAKTFTITGTDWSGSPISETVTGPNIGTVQSVLDYLTVTKITISANAAAALTVGDSGVASSPWIRFDGWAAPSINAGCVATGTVNYTVQVSMDDPNDASNSISPALMTWNNWPDTVFAGATGSFQSVVAFIPIFVRIVLNSGAGSVRGTFQQASVVPR